MHLLKDISVDILLVRMHLLQQNHTVACQARSRCFALNRINNKEN
jgi:hypothetical protein